MNALVFVDANHLNAEPFTTSDVIAEYAQITHHAMQQMVSKYEANLKSFGALAFEMWEVNKNGGKNYEKIYRLNEQQTTLLINLLKNTEPVVRFKVELVRQFYLMRDELMKRRIYREELKPIRRGMTDVIQSNPGHSKWDYKLYTDLAYKTVTGKNAAQIRKEQGASPRAKAIEYMTAEEISGVTSRENQIAVLLELGMPYKQVKTVLFNHKAMAIHPA